MRREVQIAEARKLLGYLKNRTTAVADSVYRNPVTDYTCPKQAERERELFFRKGAFNVGLSALLPNPGDWMTHDYAGVPILLSRDHEGKLGLDHCSVGFDVIGDLHTRTAHAIELVLKTFGHESTPCRATAAGVGREVDF